MTIDRTRLAAGLRWAGGLRFEATSGGMSFLLDGDGLQGASPVFALVASLAGCMAADVVHILERARLPLQALQVEVRAERAPADPRRVLRVALEFVVTGDVPDERVEHAIRLSRETYCSVWHSLGRDIELTTAVRRG